MPRLRDIIERVRSEPGFIGIGVVEREGDVLIIEFFIQAPEPAKCISHKLRVYVRNIDRPDEEAWMVE